MTALKVFAVDLFPLDLPPDDREDGRATQRRCYVAATSRKAAAVALGVTEYYLSTHGVLPAPQDPAYAFIVAEPGQAFVKLGDLSGPMEARWIRAKVSPPGYAALRCVGQPFSQVPKRPKLVIVLDVDVPFDPTSLPQDDPDEVAAELLAQAEDLDFPALRDYAGCDVRFVCASWCDELTAGEILARL